LCEGPAGAGRLLLAHHSLVAGYCRRAEDSRLPQASFPAFLMPPWSKAAGTELALPMLHRHLGTVWTHKLSSLGHPLVNVMNFRWDGSDF